VEDVDVQAIGGIEACIARDNLGGLVEKASDSNERQNG